MPDRGAGLAGGHEVLWAGGLDEAEHAPGGVDKQGHVPQLHLLRLHKDAPAQVLRALAIARDVLGQEVGHPRIRHGGLLRLRDEPGDGQALQARHLVGIVFAGLGGDFPAQHLLVEVRGLARVRGGQVDPVGHAHFSFECWHLHIPPLFRIKVIVGRGFIKVIIVIVRLAHARAGVLDAHLIAWVEHGAPARFGLAIDRNYAFCDELFSLAAGSHQAGQLDELAQFDGVAVDRNV